MVSRTWVLDPNVSSSTIKGLQGPPPGHWVYQYAADKPPQQTAPSREAERQAAARDAQQAAARQAKENQVAKFEATQRAIQQTQQELELIQQTLSRNAADQPRAAIRPVQQTRPYQPMEDERAVSVPTQRYSENWVKPANWEASAVVLHQPTEDERTVSVPAQSYSEKWVMPAGWEGDVVGLPQQSVQQPHSSDEQARRFAFQSDAEDERSRERLAASQAAQAAEAAAERSRNAIAAYNQFAALHQNDPDLEPSNEASGNPVSQFGASLRSFARDAGSALQTTTRTLGDELVSQVESGDNVSVREAAKSGIQSQLVNGVRDLTDTAVDAGPEDRQFVFRAHELALELVPSRGEAVGHFMDHALIPKINQLADELAPEKP